VKPGAFREASRAALGDAHLAAALEKTAGLLERKRADAVAARLDFEALRTWGRERKAEVSGRLEHYADRFARNARENGAEVHRARDGGEAVRLIARLLEERGARSAVKAKSMTAEEAGLTEALEERAIQVTETDLGEFIVQLAGEKPSHILAPAIHRDRSQVADLFHRELGAPPGLGVEELVAWARRTLRQRFLATDAGITGANFAVAETGTLALVTNEGNGRMATGLPRLHIAVVGIDKVIPLLADLPGFLTLLTRSASGQAISSYVTLVTGPRRSGEEDGPDELHVILLDNGRSGVAGGPYREMLHCLHCGACLNHCPVYRAVGGHAYGSVYPGPMGDVLSPLLWGLTAFPDLPQACTLCGRCAEICPVRIPLPEYHRGLRGEGGRGSPASRWAAAVLGHPRIYRRGLDLLRRLLASGLLERLPKGWTGPWKEWTSCRDAPRPQPAASFRRWWRERGS